MRSADELYEVVAYYARSRSIDAITGRQQALAAIEAYRRDAALAAIEACEGLANAAYEHYEAGPYKACASAIRAKFGLTPPKP